MGARAELELHHLSDLKQKSIKTECFRFLVELCCQIKKRVSLREMKILTALDPILATNSNQQNRPEILPLIARFRHLLIETEFDALGEECTRGENLLHFWCNFHDSTTVLEACQKPKEWSWRATFSPFRTIHVQVAGTASFHCRRGKSF